MPVGEQRVHLAARARDAAGVGVHVRPRVALCLEAAEEVADGPAVGRQARVRQLGPLDRRGHGSMRAGPHGVRRYGGLRVPVTGHVHEDATRALGLAELGGELPGMALGQHLGGATGEVAHVVERGPASQRGPDVNALGAGHLSEGREAELVEQLARPSGRTANGAEVAARRRVEVEHQAVRLLDAIRAREPDVRGNAVLPYQVDERVGVVDRDVGDRPACLRHLHSPYPGGEVVGDVLVEEALATDPVREALHAHRAGADVGQHELRHPLVVGGELTLADAVVGKQQLVWVADRDVHGDGFRNRSRARGARWSAAPRAATPPAASSG